MKGLGEVEGRRLVEARGREAFADLRDLVRRAGLNEKHLTALAESGALEGLDPSRRSSLWQVWDLAREPVNRLPLEAREDAVEFPELSAFETVSWDYRASHHSPRAHPLEPLRAELERQGLPDARHVVGMRNGARARYAGLVICRQRPGTAKGVVFMTLEDESGFVNVVVWQQVFDRFALLVKTEPFLGVAGKIQAQDGVVHLVAEQLWVPRVDVAPASGGSRDFH